MFSARRATVFAVLAFLLAFVPAQSSARAQLIQWLRVIPDAHGKPEAVVRLEAGTREGRLISPRLMKKSDFSDLRFVVAGAAPAQVAQGEQKLLPQLLDNTDRMVVIGADLLNRGPGWIVAELAPVEREWSPQRWHSFLVAEGLPVPRAVPEKPVRHRLLSSFKALVARSGSATSSQPVGLPLELVPVDGSSGNVLRVKLLQKGQPIAGVTVTAVALEAPGAASALTDGDGVARLAVSVTGEWVVSAVTLGSCSVPGFEADVHATKLTLRR